MNSAADYITTNRRQFRSKTLTIFDEQGIYTRYIEKLIPCFSNIKIVTSFTKQYNILSKKLLETYGFSLIVTRDETFNSDVIISHSCKVPLYFEGTVFTDEKRYLMNATVFSGTEIKLPDLYENLRPQNIEYKNFGC